MAMREGHIAAATPAAVMWGWTVAQQCDQGLIVGAVASVAVMAVCTAPDWDHPRFEGRLHPLAAASRWYARRGYQLGTAEDRARQRRDLHRGPTHCLETAVLMGVLVAVVLSISPLTRPVAWMVGAGVALGWADHVLLDWCTPSGVPLSALWNWYRHGEVWRRSTLSRRWTTIPLGAVRLKVIPRPCVLPANKKAPSCCDKGWFKTDKGAERAVVIPGFYAATVALGLVRAGVVTVVLAALTGVG